MDERQEARRGEINLIDIVFYCLERWRWIVVCMLIAAIAAGAYQYRAANQSIQNSVSSEKKGSELTVEYYEQAIGKMESDLKLKEDYLKNSVVMQIDPYHVSTGTLTYYVEEAGRKAGVLAAYRAFVSGGGMADMLYVSDDSISVEDLQYLISFIDISKDYDGENRVRFNTEVLVSVFQIQIRMPNSELCDSYLERAKEVLDEYTVQIQSEVGEHKINLLSSVLSEMTNMQLGDYQSGMRSGYLSAVRELQTLRTEFNTVNGETTQLTQQTDQTDQTPEMLPVNAASSAVKFAVLGLVLGAAMACFILVVSYMLGGRLQDIEAFNAEFGMPLLGMVRISGKKKRLFGFIDSWIFRLRGGSCSKINFDEQIRIVAANVKTAISKNSSDKELRKVMIAGTADEREAEELCARLASEVEGSSFSHYMQIIFQSSALNQLEDYDGILFLEKKSSSNCKFIAQEKKLASDRDVKVLGTIVLC